MEEFYPPERCAFLEDGQDDPSVRPSGPSHCGCKEIAKVAEAACEAARSDCDCEPAPRYETRGRKGGR